MAKVDNPKAGGDPSAIEMETPAQKVRRMAQEAREAHKKEIEASVEGLRIERADLLAERQQIAERLLAVRDGLKEIDQIDGKEAEKIPALLNYKSELLATEEECVQKVAIIDARFGEIESDPAMLEYLEQERIASELEAAKEREAQEEARRIERDRDILKLFEAVSGRIKLLKESLISYRQRILQLEEERRIAEEKRSRAASNEQFTRRRLLDIQEQANSLMSRLRDKNVLAISQRAGTVPPISPDELATWFDAWMPFVKPALIFGDTNLDELRALRDDPAFEQVTAARSEHGNAHEEVRAVQQRQKDLFEEIEDFLGSDVTDSMTSHTLASANADFESILGEESLRSTIDDINEATMDLDFFMQRMNFAGYSIDRVFGSVGEELKKLYDRLKR